LHSPPASRAAQTSGLCDWSQEQLLSVADFSDDAASVAVQSECMKQSI